MEESRQKDDVEVIQPILETDSERTDRIKKEEEARHAEERKGIVRNEYARRARERLSHSE